MQRQALGASNRHCPPLSVRAESGVNRLAWRSRDVFSSRFSIISINYLVILTAYTVDLNMPNAVHMQMTCSSNIPASFLAPTLIYIESAHDSLSVSQFVLDYVCSIVALLPTGTMHSIRISLPIPSLTSPEADRHSILVF